jgi:two-component system phosphate regulon sensor histidine kinase PhoR
VRFPPAIINLRRAQLTLMLAVLIPTVAMAIVGIVLLAVGDEFPGILAGILVLTLCTTGITGYILGSIFVGKGASMARIQNDFLSSVSHELRTPITSINLLLESLRDGRLDADDTRQVFGLLAQETDRLEHLVGRLLELSRLETGSHVFDKKPVSVDELVDEAIAAFDAASLSNPTPVARDIESGLTLIGDRGTLVRALVNLLTNAWKYTEDNDKQIAISARPSKSGRWIEISVVDNGMGMSRAEQRLLFARFARGKAAIDRRTPGIGLGLSFVRAIVRGHRGRIAVESRVGAGARFTLRLRPCPSTTS